MNARFIPMHEDELTGVIERQQTRRRLHTILDEPRPWTEEELTLMENYPDPEVDIDQLLALVADLQAALLEQTGT